MRHARKKKNMTLLEVAWLGFATPIRWIFGITSAVSVGALIGKHLAGLDG